MKKLILATAVAIASMTVQAQIEMQASDKRTVVGKAKNGAYTQSELSYTVNGTDTLYTFMYSNSEYQTMADYQSIQFDGSDNTVEAFYKIMKSFFTDENKKNKDYKAEFKLGSENILASNKRVMGVTSIQFITKKGWLYLTEKQVDKIFGKK